MKVDSFFQSAASKIDLTEAPLYKAHDGPIARVE